MGNSEGKGGGLKGLRTAKPGQPGEPKRPLGGKGAPIGNSNAAKEGQDLRFEVYLSKTRRGFLEEWFEMVYGYKPGEEKLREVARQLANAALDRAIIEEFERRQPGRVAGSSGETF